MDILSGTYARDKDAVSASLLVCEMAAVYKAKNQTLLDALHELYERYGYYKETLVSFTFEGIEGIAKMEFPHGGTAPAPTGVLRRT